MKQLVKTLAIAVVLMFIGISTFAQVTATASTTATIVANISISKWSDLNFGRIAVSSALGTVTLAPDPAVPAPRTYTGGISFPAAVGTVTAAAFIATGQPGDTYAVTLPAGAITLTNTTGSGGETMLVDTWTDQTFGANAGLFKFEAGGTQTFFVGATLHVAGNQVPGVYFNAADLSVTINYN
jgi:hypothetical protein